MLLHVLVLSVFAVGMAAVIVLSCMGTAREDEPGQRGHEDPGEPGEPGEQELRAAA